MLHRIKWDEQTSNTKGEGKCKGLWGRGWQEITSWPWGGKAFLEETRFNRNAALCNKHTSAGGGKNVGVCICGEYLAIPECSWCVVQKLGGQSFGV